MSCYFELDTLLSQFDWSEFDNHAQRNIAPEQMMLSSNTFNNCSVNICFNTKSLVVFKGIFKACLQCVFVL